jgi:hypothetical protein
MQSGEIMAANPRIFGQLVTALRDHSKPLA